MIRTILNLIYTIFQAQYKFSTHYLYNSLYLYIDQLHLYVKVEYLHIIVLNTLDNYNLKKN